MYSNKFDSDSAIEKWTNVYEIPVEKVIGRNSF